jgi:hypothetical protein
LPNYVQIPGARAASPLIQGGFTVYESGGFGVRLSYLQLLIILALMAGFTTFIAATPLGRAQRACEQDIRMAAVLGVDVDRVISTTFMMGAALMLSGTGSELLANPDVRAAYLEVASVTGLRGDRAFARCSAMLQWPLSHRGGAFHEPAASRRRIFRSRWWGRLPAQMPRWASR